MYSLRILSVTLLGLVLLAPSAHAQDTLAQERKILLRNHVSVEVGGSGGIYTLNYERQLTQQFTARVGFEYFPLVENGSRDTNVALAAPIILSFVPELVRLWGAPLSAELGAGMLLLYTSGTEATYRRHEGFPPEVTGTRSFRDFTVGPTAVAGLRLYIADERVAFRAGVVTLPNRSAWQAGEFLLWPLLSVGYRF